MPIGVYKRNSNMMTGRAIPSKESRLKMRLAHLGKKLSERTKKKVSKNNARYWFGKKVYPHMKEILLKEAKRKDNKKWSLERKVSASKRLSGNKTNLWKGGVTPINRKIRGSLVYREWRNQVYQRDNWICQECKIRGGRLQAHHIKSFSEYPELRFDLNNGVTLCLDCHKKTDNYMKKPFVIKNQTLEGLIHR